MSGPKMLRVFSTLAVLTATAATHNKIKQLTSVRFKQRQSIHVLYIRGGAEFTERKSKSSKKSARASGKTKTVINEKMKEKDAAILMGDAIRDQAEILLRDKLPYPERMFDAALVSLGLSLGTAGTDADNSDSATSSKKKSDDKFIETPYYQYTYRYPRMSNKQYVQPSTSAVIANYFLKTHGGTHLIQCLLSLLASVLGVACLLLPSFPTNVSDKIDVNSLIRGLTLASAKCSLLQQTLLLAVAKHASGLIGALLLGASKIPELGLRDTRKYLEVVTSDPVGQYLFYCSLLVVWLNLGAAQIASMKTLVTSLQNAATIDSNDKIVEVLNRLSQNPPPWYLKQSTGGYMIPIIMLLPILLREVISIAWVVSDVLTLAFTSSRGLTGKFMHGMLLSARSIIDATMSIVVTSEKWRKADSFTRQRTLAMLVSRCSLGMELAVGGILIGDAIQLFWRFAFVLTENGATKPSYRVVLGKILCAHLYLNFLLSRRKSIKILIGSIRGGAFLDRVLDVLIDPEKEMGLIEEEKDDNAG